MAELSPILVQVKLEADKLKADLDQASSKLKGFGDTANSTSGPVSSLGGHLKGLVAGFIGLAAAQKAAQYLNEAAKATAEDAKSAGLLEQQLKNSTGATKEQTAAVEASIKSMSLQYGVADDKLRPAFATLVRSTKDVAEATKLTDLAQNIAAGTGRSLESVSLALGKAHAGNLGALQRLVPGIKDAADPMAELAKQFDGAAAKAANLDPYQRLNVAMGEIKESIGRLVLPLVTALADAMVKIEPVISKVVDAFMKLGQGDFSGIQSLFTDLTKGISDFISGGGLTKAFEGFAQMREKLLTSLVEALPAIIGALAELLPKIIETIVAMIPEILKSGIELFMALVNAVIEVAPKIIDELLNAIPEIIMTLLNALPDLLMAAVDLFMSLVEAITTILPKILTTLTEDVLPKIIDTLVKLIPILIPAAVELFLGLVSGLAKALPKIITAVIEMIPKLAKAIIEAIPIIIDAGFQLLKGLIKGIWDNAPKLVVSLAKDLGNLLVDSVKAIFGIKSPSTVFAGIGKNIALGLDAGIRSGIGDVTNAMGALTNATGIGGTIGVGVSGSFAGYRGAPGSIRNSTSNQSINVNVQAQTDATPSDIAKAAVNAIRFGLPTRLA